MLDNHAYNLMSRLVEESRALWHIKEFYENDADGCEVCLDFFERQVKTKENEIEELTVLVKAYLD